MELVPTGRVLLFTLVLLSCATAPCSGTLRPLLRHVESSPPRSWKIENSLGLKGSKQLENILQVVPGWDLAALLRDWSTEMMPLFPVLKGLPAKDSRFPSLGRRAWVGKFPVQARNRGSRIHRILGDYADLTRVTLGKSWSSDWLEPTTNEEVKRSIVVADDVAFREKSKFLTALERQKWLNSVLRKLVTN
ncbi:tuberoinfundibular peptide of 39 residues isoform X2 [Heptranchias perlo]